MRNEGDPPWRAALVSFVGASAGAGWELRSAGGRAGAGLRTGARLPRMIGFRTYAALRGIYTIRDSCIGIIELHRVAGEDGVWYFEAY